MQVQRVGDFAQHERAHRDFAVLEEVALPVDDGLRYAQDRIEPLLHVLDEPARFLQLAGELLMPGIAGGAMLAFTLSLDDFVISFMTASPSSTTLPVHIYASVRRGLSPELHALSAVMLLVTVALVLGWQRLSRRPTMGT